MAVQMELSRILIREMNDVQLIELTEVDGPRSFPIAIGLPEAFAIERRLKEMPAPRPQTHDLLATVIRALGGELRRIRIHDLDSGTFFARLVIDRDGEMIEVDSRPSDAIALGVAEQVPILVEESVIEAATSREPELETEFELDDEDGESEDDEFEGLL